MSAALSVLGILAFLGLAIYLIRDEARRDRLEADAWNATRPKQEWPS